MEAGLWRRSDLRVNATGNGDGTILAQMRADRARALLLLCKRGGSADFEAYKDEPRACVAVIAKERRLDREHIEPRHVTSRIAAFEDEVLHREFGHAPESQLPKRPSN